MKLRFRTILAFILLLPLSSWGNSEISCDFKVAGFETKEVFLQFFDLLGKTTIDGKSTELSKLVLYPLRVNSSKKKRLIKSPAEFQKQFPKIFTQKVRSAILNQKIETLFCRDQGVMYGDGEVWVSTRNHQVGIVAINL